MPNKKIDNNSKSNPSAEVVSQLILQTKQLTLKIQNMLVEEETLLQKLQHPNGDAWAALRRHQQQRQQSSNGRHHDQYPPLYIYLNEDHRHRNNNNNCKNHNHNAVAETSESKPTAAADDDTNGGDFLSMKRVNGSNIAGNQRLSFAQFTELDPSAKLACIHSMLREPSKESYHVGVSFVPDEESSI